jgi:hypothetical protein
MNTNFTVIFSGRQHFGDERTTFNDVEPNVDGNAFVGHKKDFTFDCPNINPNETAVLMFQSRDVSKSQRNIFRVNQVDVFGANPASGTLPASGGIPASADRNSWNGNIQLLETRHRLKATGNTLHIEARNDAGGVGGNIDDFILDNMVIMYKIRTPPPTNQL